MATYSDANALEIKLDIVAEGYDLRDRALAQEVGYELFTHLQKESKSQQFRIKPADTRTLGAGDEFLVLWQFVHDNQEIVIAALGGAITILKLIHKKLSENKKLSHVLAKVDVPGKEVTAQGAAPIEEVLASLEKDYQQRVEMKEDGKITRSETIETKITIKVIKTQIHP